MSARKNPPGRPRTVGLDAGGHRVMVNMDAKLYKLLRRFMKKHERTSESGTIRVLLRASLEGNAGVPRHDGRARALLKVHRDRARHGPASKKVVVKAGAADS